MSRIVNGTITVPEFTSTGNVGEYNVAGATYINHSDTAGNGTYDIQPNFVIYVPASDVNSFELIPGVVHRYRITAINVVDQGTVDLVITWDEVGPELDTPTNGIDCLITQVSARRKFGYIVDTALYPNLQSYVVSAALNSDIENIDDIAVSTSTTQTYLHTQTELDTIWTISHNKNNVNYVYTIFDDTGEQTLPNAVETIDANTIELHFLAGMTGKVIFMFV